MQSGLGLALSLGRVPKTPPEHLQCSQNTSRTPQVFPEHLQNTRRVPKNWPTAALGLDHLVHEPKLVSSGVACSGWSSSVPVIPLQANFLLLCECYHVSPLKNHLVFEVKCCVKGIVILPSSFRFGKAMPSDQYLW